VSTTLSDITVYLLGKRETTRDKMYPIVLYQVQIATGGNPNDCDVQHCLHMNRKWT